MSRKKEKKLQMKCERARELFSVYHENNIEYALMVALRAHMDECSSCKDEYDCFRHTWSALNALPEVEPPAHLRHDIVMRVARMQHENAQSLRKPFWMFGVRSLLSRAAPGRLAAVAGILIALVIMMYGETAVDVFRSWMGPVYRGVPQQQITGDASPVHASATFDSSMKELWQSRQLGRNSLWVTVEPKHNQDGRILYRVLLSINQNSFYGDEICNRIGAEVYLLAPDVKGKPDRKLGDQVWEGSILSDKPVLVPAVIDRSQGLSGSVNLLVVWKFRNREFSQIVYLPSEYRSVYSESIYISPWNDQSDIKAESGLYDRLQRISQNYGAVIIANADIDSESQGIVVGDGDLDWMLRSTLKPIKLDWMIADHAVYIDRPYPFETP